MPCLDAQGATGLEEALRNTPGVTQQATSPTTSNNFVSRGVLMNARTNYRLNGALQNHQSQPVPIENKQRVELLKGVSALYYGIATPSGIVNVVTKRAGIGRHQPLRQRRCRKAASARGWTWAASSDRTGSSASGSTAMQPRRDPDRRRQRPPLPRQRRVRLAGDRHIVAEAGRRALSPRDGRAGRHLAFGIPAAGDTIPNPHNRYAPVDMPYRTWSTNVLGRADYALGSEWSVRVEGGLATSRRQRGRADFSFTDAASVATGEGRIAGSYTPRPELSQRICPCRDRRQAGYLRHPARNCCSAAPATGRCRRTSTSATMHPPPARRPRSRTSTLRGPSTLTA